MDNVPSATFRRTYAKLTTTTIVTVNGHPIGQWTPISTAIDTRALDAIRPGEPTSTVELTTGLRPYSTRPFTPVPKRGK
jgi:hypothetical protein